MFKYGDLRLRPIETSDLDFMYEVRTDPSTADMVGTLHLKSKEDQYLWFKCLKEDRTKAYYVLELDQKSKVVKIGYLRFDEIDLLNRSMRVGGDLHKDYRSKGYGHQMMLLIKEFCFGCMNMHRIWLLVLSTNLVAKHIYEKAGFKKEGVMRKAVYKNGEYIDYEMWALLK